MYAYTLLNTADAFVFLIEATGGGVTDWVILKQPRQPTGVGQQLHTFKAPDSKSAVEMARSWLADNYADK